MNTVSNVPLPGLAPELPLASATVLPEHRRSLNKLKDLLVSIYAYGVLLFGLLVPVVLGGWYKFFGPGSF